MTHSTLLRTLYLGAKLTTSYGMHKF